MKHRSTERSGRWLRFVLAAIVLLVQAAVPMHALAMQRGGGDDVLALLNDPGVICHADPDADGRSDQMPGHAGDCVACGMCQLAASLPLLPTGAAVPAPRVALVPAPLRFTVYLLPPATASPTPPARGPPATV